MITNQCTNEETNKIFEGMNLLLRYYPDANIRAEHHTIQFGDALDYYDYCDETDTYSFILERFSNKDLDKLRELGWYINKTTFRWMIDT